MRGGRESGSRIPRVAATGHRESGPPTDDRFVRMMEGNAIDREARSESCCESFKANGKMEE